jgi:long-chain fatty acid transport protein
MSRRARWCWILLVVLATVARGRSALAAGMFVTAHGARPLGRAGAFVAGADDLNAIFYNPAGVAAIDYGQTGWSGLLDAGFVLQNVAYTRDENGVMRPTVQLDGAIAGSAPLFIPQFGFARKLKRAWGTMSFGFGVWIPYTGLPRYPEPSYASEADIQAVPDVGPQRYQIIGLHEGSLARTTVGAVLNPVAAFSLLKDRLLLGFGPQLLVAYLRSRLMLSGCTQVMCRPEQPDYDTLVLAQAFAITPSFNLGAIGRPLDWLQLGLAFQFPFFVRSAVGTVDTRLPPNDLFNGASVEGRDASLSANLPPILRLGTELRPLRIAGPDKFPTIDLRIELAYIVEFWSVQKNIMFVPNDISIVNLKGIGSYKLGPVALRRDMMDTHTIALGFEAALWKYFGARLGAMFETNSMPDATLTVLTPDNHKGLIAFGLFVPKVRFAKTDWRLDFSYGRIIQPDRYVAPQDSQLQPSNPIRPDVEYPPGVGGIGGGTYQVSYDIIAFGFSAVR